MSNRLLRFPEVQARVGYSRDHLSRLEKAGKFPKRVKLNGSAPQSPVAWVEDEIDAWVKQKMQDREREATSLQGGGDGREHVAA